MLSLTQEAQAKLRTLAECLDLADESAAVNELFYQFVLSQDTGRRKIIMAAYQINTASKH